MKIVKIKHILLMCTCLLLAKTQVAVAQNPADDLFAQGNQATKPSEPKKTGVITIGTRRHEVRALLGKPSFESSIPSLRRLRECYADGTEVTFVEERAISVKPGDLLKTSSDGSFVVERETATATIDPSVLRECGIFGADKCSVEESFWYCPPGYVAPIYDGIPFTPTFGYVPADYPDGPHYFCKPGRGSGVCIGCSCKKCDPCK